MSPNITASWVLALAPEIALLVVLFCVLIFEKLFKPSNPRQVGLFTAWGGVVRSWFMMAIPAFGD